MIGGMLAETFIGRFFVPAIFYVVEKFSGAEKRKAFTLTSAEAPRSGGLNYEEYCTLRNPCRDGSRSRLHDGPEDKRPAVNVPQEYRTPEPQQATQASSLGNEQWWQLYQDPVLAQLIHTAIAQNYDVRIAAARVLEAQAQVGITRSNQLPSANVGADIFSQQNAKVTKVFPAYQVNGGELNLSVIWNLDFWGKYRRQTEAARAQLLATEWGQRAVLSSLVGNVATAYFQLRALDSELEISQRTLASRQQSLKLTQFLESYGSNSGLDVSQAEQLVYTASETIPDLERQIQQQ